MRMRPGVLTKAPRSSRNAAAVASAGVGVDVGAIEVNYVKESREPNCPPATEGKQQNNLTSTGVRRG